MEPVETSLTVSLLCHVVPLASSLETGEIESERESERERERERARERDREPHQEEESTQKTFTQ